MVSEETHSKAVYMRWNEIKEDKPDLYCNVLVARCNYDNDNPYYFTASYIGFDKSWKVKFFFPNDNKSSYTKIIIPYKETDRWMYIPHLEPI